MPGPSPEITAALETLRDGGMVAITDDLGHPWTAIALDAERVTPDDINLLVRAACGMLYLALPGARCDALGLSPMARAWGGSGRLALSVSIEAREGTSTGISAADRARTIRVAADAGSGPDDVVSPGHIFPVRVDDGGVAGTPACAEAMVDLVRAAGGRGPSVLCGVMADDGHMAAGRDIEDLCARHALPLVHLSDVVAWARGH